MNKSENKIAGSLRAPHEIMADNIAEVNRLIAIHEKLTGKGPGYKSNVEVLNKSCTVLLVACWEAFVEDMAENAFRILFINARDPNLFPKGVLVGAARKLRESKDEGAVWKLAGDGWKKVLGDYKQEVIKRHCGTLNTPKPDQVNSLFAHLLGIKHLSSHWHWLGVSADKAKKKLEELVELRGAIAHRVKVNRKVYKHEVRSYTLFINRIAMETSNAVGKFIFEKTKHWPWPQYVLRSNRPKPIPKSDSDKPLTDPSPTV